MRLLRSALVALLAVLALAGPAHASTVPQPGGAPLFGPLLDWGSDSASAYAQRLGATPSLYAQSAPFPLGEAEDEYLRQFLRQVSQQGATALLTLEPRGDLAGLDEQAAEDLARRVEGYRDDTDVPLLLRFAPEMNTAYRPWGLRPEQYTRAFRLVADAVHRLSPGTGMVWSPAYGAGYPFGGLDQVPAPGTPDFDDLDTDGDGEVDDADDPYGPFWPGDEAVDVVGANAYWFGPRYPFGDNVVPPPGALADRLTGQVGYSTPGQSASRDLATRFSRDRGLPLLLETAALHVEGLGGDDELAVKAEWLRQVLGPQTRERFPQLLAVVWLEVERPEPAAGGEVVDWRATSTPQLAEALRGELVRGGLQLGPVRPARAAGEGGEAREPVSGTVLTGAPAWAVVAGGVVVGLVLLAGALRRGGRWRYVQEGDRDLRIDLLRGLAIVFVVLNHVNLPSLFHLLTQEALGPVSGAELFVLLSGVVLGVVHRPRLARDGLGGVATPLFRRAWRLYLTALVVVLSVYAVGLLPGVDARVVTTFTDLGAGGPGGTTYDLYSGIEGLLAYPVPGEVLADVLLLRLGPFQFNVMGLYVVLLLVAPLLLWAFQRRLLPVVLLVSAGLYALQAARPVRLLDAQFEDAFPLLAWQVLFVLGVTAGYYRETLLRAAATRAGRVVVAVTALAYLGLLFFTWNNPYAANRYDVVLRLVPETTFRDVYADWFERTPLDLGRLLAVVVLLVVLYAALTAYWGPVHRALGRVLVPLGQASLYVFVVHVYLALLVANLPGAQDAGVLVGTLLHTAVLAALWLLVRYRVLFGIVPR